jgi:leucyl/phenylalanyl-tRNA--protein transferase
VTEWGATPFEPPPTMWEFPAVAADAPDDFIAAGADLEPGTLLAAYRQGLFPMPLDGPPGFRRRRATIGWWSPNPRGIVPLDGLRVTRSLRRSVRDYEIRWSTAFREVVHRCADPSRPKGWITPAIVDAYSRLHELGWAHSVEAYDPVTGELAGGLYGVRIERFFAGESMFHIGRDASKVCLVALVERLAKEGALLLDVQWTTAHLVSLGAIDVDRAEYLERLGEAVATGG